MLSGQELRFQRCDYGLRHKSIVDCVHALSLTVTDMENFCVVDSMGVDRAVDYNMSGFQIFNTECLEHNSIVLYTQTGLVLHEYH